MKEVPDIWPRRGCSQPLRRNKTAEVATGEIQERGFRGFGSRVLGFRG